MHLYKLGVLLILNVVFVQAWYTTVVENGKTIVKTKSRSRSSVATSSSTTTTSVPTTTTSSSTTITSIPTTTTSSSTTFTTTITTTTTTSSSTTTTSDSTTTTSDSATTTTTSPAVPSPTDALNFYRAYGCSGDPIQTSNGDGCFNFRVIYWEVYLESTSSSALQIGFHYPASCGGLYPLAQVIVYPNTCVSKVFTALPYLSYKVTTL